MDKNNLNEEVKQIWNGNALFWDSKIGSKGNDFHRILIEPSQLRLLDLKKGDMILDIACGNGQFARKMADMGAKVTAFDLSENFITIAREHSKGYDIEYFVMDCTDRDKFLKLGEKRFDRAVCTMAIMDMAEIEPLASSLAVLLKKGAPFVFSICHPCYNSGKMKRIVEQEDTGGEIVTTHSVMIFEYNTSSARKGVGIKGQPLPHYYFHRSMSELFSVFFRHGFVIDGMEEPVFPQGTKSDIFWQTHMEIPPAIVVKMRLI